MHMGGVSPQGGGQVHSHTHLTMHMGGYPPKGGAKFINYGLRRQFVDIWRILEACEHYKIAYFRFGHLEMHIGGGYPPKGGGKFIHTHN